MGESLMVGRIEGALSTCARAQWAVGSEVGWIDDMLDVVSV